MGKHSPLHQEEQKGGEGITPLVATRKCKEGLCEVDRVTMSPATNPGMEKQEKVVLFLWRTMSSHLKWNKHGSDEPRRVPPPISTASGTRFPYSAVLRRGTNPRSDKTNVVQGWERFEGGEEGEKT